MSKASVCFVVIFFLVCACSHSIGEDVDSDYSMVVFATYPIGKYDLGSEVNVTVHVFEAGEYSDPEEIELRFAGTGFSANISEVPLVREAQGRYRGTFVIESDMLDEKGRVKVRTVALSVEGQIASDGLTIRTIYNYFHIDALWTSAPQWLLVKGEKVDIEIRTFLFNELIDPNPGTLKARLKPEDEPFEYPNVTRLSKGRYQISLNIPHDIKSDYYEMQVDAELTIDINTSDGPRELVLKDKWYDQIPLQVLRIWLHVSRLTQEMAFIELFVHYPDWTPVGGATVHATFSDAAWGWSQIGTTRETTDATGRASFLVDISSLEGEERMFIVEGFVERDELNQSFEQTLLGPELGYWSYGENDGMRAIPIIEPLIESDDAQVTTRLMVEDSVLSNQTVYVYYVNNYEVLGYFSSITNAEGKVTNRFPLPERTWGFLMVSTIPTGIFYSQVNGSWVSSYHVYPLLIESLGELTLPPRSPSTEMTVGPVVRGQKVEVTISRPDEDGENELVRVLWGVGPTKGYGTNRPWHVANSKSNVPMGGYVNLERTGGKYIGTIQLPPFLPAGTVIHIGAEFFMMDSGNDYYGPMRAFVIQEGEDSAPTCAIDEPGDGEVVARTMQVKGTASDDISVQLVEVRFDSGEWINATGTEDWTAVINLRSLATGNYTIEARSFDGSQHSEVSFVVVQLVGDKNGDDDGRNEERIDDIWPWFLLFLILAVGLSLGALLLKRRID